MCVYGTHLRLERDVVCELDEGILRTWSRLFIMNILPEQPMWPDVMLTDCVCVKLQTKHTRPRTDRTARTINHYIWHISSSFLSAGYSNWRTHSNTRLTFTLLSSLVRHTLTVQYTHTELLTYKERKDIYILYEVYTCVYCEIICEEESSISKIKISYVSGGPSQWADVDQNNLWTSDVQSLISAGRLWTPDTL